MTTMFRSLSIGLVFSGLCALPALARDHHRHSRHDSHSHHFRPSVSFGFYSGGYYPHSYFGDPFYHPFYAPPTVIYTQPRTVYVEREQRRSLERDVQAALASKGYYGAEIDGVVGSRTRAAIRAYQVDRNLPVTGRIDGNLLRSLKLI